MGAIIQRSEKLTQQVYKYLKHEILSGRIAAGERVVETKLAQELQTSRSPIREAMRLLLSEQILVEQNGFIYVVQPSFQDLLELYELRIALETTMASSAAEKITLVDLKRLEVNLEETKQLFDAGQYEDLPSNNAEFHQIIWKCTGNHRIINILENVSELINFYCYLIFKISRAKSSMVDQHQSIINALSERNKDAAYERMRVHVATDMAIIKKEMNKSGR